MTDEKLKGAFEAARAMNAMKKLMRYADGQKARSGDICHKRASSELEMRWSL
jgi:hypothetical protein